MDRIRRCAEAFLARPGLLDRLDERVVATLPAPAAADPALVRVVTASNRSNCVHWVRALARRPDGPVPANTSADVLDPAADIVRRGLDAAALDAYRTGQHLLWQAWSEVVLDTVDDLADARAVLAATEGSLSAFVTATLEVLLAHVEHHRAELVGAGRTDRLRAVLLLLDGEPISDDRAARLLRYDLRGCHGAAIVPGDASEHAIDRALRTAGAAQVLTVRASSRAIWVWWSDAGRLSPARVGELLDGPGVALGATATGRDGFGRVHRQARAVQHLLAGTGRRATVRHDEVEAVVLAGRDPAEAADFVARRLGPLRDAPAELRDTLRVYLREQSSAARTARAVHAHRNTVVARVERAMELVPDARPLELELALELHHWAVSPPPVDTR